MQTETTVSSVSEFVQRIIELNNVLIQDGGPKNEILLFRGQPNENFELLPSIAREQRFSCDISIFGEERNMIEMAKYKLPNIFNDTLSPIELLALLQHHEFRLDFRYYRKCTGCAVFCLFRKRSSER